MSPETWAKIELMGHVVMAGRLSEEEKFGGKLGRLDIPTSAKCTCPNAVKTSVEQPSVPCEACHGSGLVQGFMTQYFGAASVYRISIVTEEVARHVSRQTAPAPVSPWDFPKQLTAILATPDRTMTCGHTPENCDCDPPNDENDDFDEYDPHPPAITPEVL